MEVDIRPLAESDLAEADRIFRLAFSTFIGLPDPAGFMPGADLIGTRWRADPAATLGAYDGGRLVGSNVAANWGSFGFFGPLTVHPDLWDKGVARKLLTATMEMFERWGTRQAALFTFPDSPKHIGFYGTFGFKPQALTPVLAKTVERTDGGGEWTSFSALAGESRASALAACRHLTEAVYPGLDLGREIAAATRQGIGDTVLIRQDGALAAFAICHLGPGSEAGDGTAYIKFGAGRPGAGAPAAFERLLAACEALAATRGLERLMAGANLARSEAHRILEARGFVKALEGIAMHRPDDPAYNRADRLVIDDWR